MPALEQLVPMTATICGSETSAWAAVVPPSVEHWSSWNTNSMSWPRTWPLISAATCAPYWLSVPRSASAVVMTSAVPSLMGCPDATSTVPNSPVPCEAAGSEAAGSEPTGAEAGPEPAGWEPGAVVAPVPGVQATATSIAAKATPLSFMDFIRRSPPCWSSCQAGPRPERCCERARSYARVLLGGDATLG